MSIDSLFLEPYTPWGNELEELVMMSEVASYLTPFFWGIISLQDRAQSAERLYLINFNNAIWIQKMASNYWSLETKTKINQLKEKICQLKIEGVKKNFSAVIQELEDIPNSCILFREIIAKRNSKAPLLTLFHRLLRSLNGPSFIDFIAQLDLNRLPLTFIAIFMKKMEEIKEADPTLRSFHKPENAIQNAIRMRNSQLLKKLMEISPSWISLFKIGKDFVRENDIEALKFLKEQKVITQERWLDDNENLFVLAAREGRIEAASELTHSELPESIKEEGLKEAIFAHQFQFFETFKGSWRPSRSKAKAWLCLSLEKNNLKAFDYMVNQGFELDPSEDWIDRAFQNNCGDETIVYLLHNNCKTDDKNTFERAFNKDFYKTMEEMLERGKIDLDEPVNGNTWLMRACRDQKIKAVHLFLRHGANPHLVNSEKISPVEYSKKYNFEVFTFDTYMKKGVIA